MITVECEDSVLTVGLSGEIDHHTAKPMRERIDECVQRLRPSHLVLDFGGVGFMDSSGIGLVMGRYRLMKELGGSVEVANAQPQISRMMKLAGLARLGI